MTIFARLLLTVAVAAAVAPARAQLLPAPAPRPVAPAPSRSSTRTVIAIIAAVDAPARTVSLRIEPDKRLQLMPPELVVAVQDVTCRPFKNGRAVTLADFAAGERVAARLMWRTVPQPVIVLRDLYDVVSYDERQRRGKETCVGIVAGFDAAALSVRRSDGVVIAFRVSDKTRFVKNDAPATPAAFPPGAPVAVKPRRLPSGDLQAAIVGGNAQEVAWAYRDALTTWTGSVTGIQGDERGGAVVSMNRDDGAKRQFLLPPGAKFKQGRSELPWRMLPGAAISAHLVKAADANTMRSADGVKLASRRARGYGEDMPASP